MGKRGKGSEDWLKTIGVKPADATTLWLLLHIVVVFVFVFVVVDDVVVVVFVEKI